MSAFGRPGATAFERYEHLRDVVGVDSESAHLATSASGRRFCGPVRGEVLCDHGNDPHDCSPCLIRQAHDLEMEGRLFGGLEDE